MRKRGVQLNGQRLIDLYQRRGWSQQDLAEKAGLDVRTVAKVKRGGICDASTLQLLASALDIEPEALLQLEAAVSAPSSSDATPSVADETAWNTGLKLLQVWKVIDLRNPNSHGDIPSGLVWERYRFLKRNAECTNIVFPYLTWGDSIECLSHPEGSQWRRVPISRGDIVHSDKQWELCSIAPEGPIGTHFEIGPIQLRFVNAFHGEGAQWWQIRVAYEIESLIVQVLFANNLRSHQIFGTWAAPGQRNFVPLPNNEPHLLPDGSIASWYLSKPTIGAFYKLAWDWSVGH